MYECWADTELKPREAQLKSRQTNWLENTFLPKCFFVENMFVDRVVFISVTGGFVMIFKSVAQLKPIVFEETEDFFFLWITITTSQLTGENQHILPALVL